MSQVILSDDGDELRLEGNIAFNNVVDLRKQGENIIKKIKTNSLQINFSGVKKTDITGLTLILSWFRFSQRFNISVKVSHLPESLLKMAMVCGVEKMLLR